MIDQELLVFFYQDAIEQLDIMESALLDAQEGTSDLEKIGEIFRAMHTIKGSAGMFGFEDIVSLTHKAENLLDEIREERIELSSDISSILMSVKDVVALLVENHVNEEPLDEEIADTIIFLENELLKHSTLSLINIENSEVLIEDVNLDDFEEESIWHISLRLLPDFFTSGMGIESTLKFLKKQGEILQSILIYENVPTIEDINHILVLNYLFNLHVQKMKLLKFLNLLKMILI